MALFEYNPIITTLPDTVVASPDSKTDIINNVVLGGVKGGSQGMIHPVR